MECPPNFGLVGNGIYRSSFPRPEHFEFLKSLKLKSILLLLPEGYPADNQTFVEEQKIRLFQLGLSGNKEPFVHMDERDVKAAVKVALNPDNHPILIHCNQGKHRTGCVVGCIRRMQDWSLAMIFEEYRRYAYPKIRALDQLIIELFPSQEKEDETNAGEHAELEKGLQSIWS